jgi:isopenicillin N synthase-like dioxygenase
MPPDLSPAGDGTRGTCLPVVRLLPLPTAMMPDFQQMSDLDWFSSRHRKPSACIFRLLYYPALPSDIPLEDGADIRAGAHSDYGSITLLFQRPSQPGLEILTPESTWAPVPVIPKGYKTSTTFPPILVNIADLLSYWTNGYLKSTVHRVIFPKDTRRGGEDRYSIAYFCHPSDDVELVPVPSKIVAERTMAEGEKVGYGGGTEGQKAMTAKEHLDKRLEATYHFKINKKAQVMDATA